MTLENIEANVVRKEVLIGVGIEAGKDRDMINPALVREGVDMIVKIVREEVEGHVRVLLTRDIK